MNLKSAIYITIFLLSCFRVIAQDSAVVKYDDRPIQTIPLDEDIIEKYQADEDFNYYQKPKTSVTLWETIKQWFRDLMAAFFGKKAVQDLNDFLVYLVFGVAILIAVVLLLRAQKRNLFYTPSRRLDYDVGEENIHEINFEDQINQAREEGNFRKAIRLVYLHAIKLLSDKNIIKWIPGKTNHEYLEEINSGELKTAFSDLGFYFEYVWYGHFDAGSSTFEKVKKLFNQVKSGENFEA